MIFRRLCTPMRGTSVRQQRRHVTQTLFRPLPPFFRLSFSLSLFSLSSLHLFVISVFVPLLSSFFSLSPPLSSSSSSSFSSSSSSSSFFFFFSLSLSPSLSLSLHTRSRLACGPDWAALVLLPGPSRRALANHASVLEPQLPYHVYHGVCEERMGRGPAHGSSSSGGLGGTRRERGEVEGTGEREGNQGHGE